MINVSSFTIHACRSCGSTDLKPVLSLGITPLANRLLTENQIHQAEPTFPLDVVFCANCTLVQITETVDPEILFSDYFYFSSFSDTALNNAKDITQRLIQDRHLDTSSLAAEVASNDGYLLQYYNQQNIPVLGIEPAQNIAAVANQKGIHTVAHFFGAETARRLQLEGFSADVLHANNVLAHVADLNGFVEGLGILIKPSGVIVIEVPYVRDLIAHREFDTIYHEHLCYFSLTALSRLFQRHHMTIVDVEYLTIHGGSLRVFAQRQDGPLDIKSVRPKQMLDEEQSWGVSEHSFYKNFGAMVSTLKEDLLQQLTRLKQAGKRIAVYGASAKGSTLLNFFNIGANVLDYVVDRSTVKQGHYTPGTHLYIFSPEKLIQDRPDYVLLLSWNFASEILDQQAAYRAAGGKFIIPIPEVKIV
ncbi:MAG: class I SAM-dependent methyltransferase [Anaerolineae bacterium]|jgi:SAM-dependent methyltransferase|nr:class I SAM-dependent methyltransferase [Anaerolineae bacterium]